MKKIIILMLVVVVLFAAWASKPDDKTCIVEAVKSVWGERVPKEETPRFYNQFMDLTSQSVEINDWIFLKRIQYKFNSGYATVGFGAFKKVFTIKRVTE